jgi:hypothetical protein
MFKTLCENSEIHSFLLNFPPNYWKTAIQALCLHGLQQFQLQKLPITFQTIESILHPSETIKKTLSFMKNELKTLNSAIKRIERRTQSSTDLNRDLNLTQFERPKMKHYEIKPRNSDCGPGSNLKTLDLKRVNGILSKNKQLKEPRICNLNDAQKIMKKLGVGKGEIDSSVELFRSRASQSTQDNSPKGFKSKQVIDNFTFGM